MNNEQLDSQLSAMFDDELPEPECELLARRLARDEGLKARWGRYAIIAACIRMERGGEEATSGAARASGRQATASNGEARSPGSEARPARMPMNGDLAGRVSRMIAAEPPLLAGGGAGRTAQGLVHPTMRRWWQPLAAGAVVAAGVAAAAILWLRAGSPDAPIVAQSPMLARTAKPLAARVTVPSSVVPVAVRSAKVANSAAASAAPSTPDSFVVPPPAPSSSFAPPVELANFVVAHSEYSMPLVRHSALSALVADEPATDDASENSSAAADRPSAGADGAGKAANAPPADPAR